MTIRTKARSQPIRNPQSSRRPHWELNLRTVVKIAWIAIALCMGTNNWIQVESFEKQALAVVQQMPAFDLDAELPKLPFADWFKQVTGPQAGVVWQLAECGERKTAPDKEEQDLSACVEASAVLPSGAKLIVGITVGTFKKGLNGKPTFFGAVINSKDQLYQILRLRDLPRMLRAPEEKTVNPLARKSSMNPVKLPRIRSDQKLNIILPYFANLSLSSPSMISMPGALGDIEAPPPPLILQQKPQKVLEGVVRGNAIIKVKPLHPESAKKMNAYGPVEVRIIISQEGTVIEAEAISGHLALRSAAVEAARKWVFKPTTVNGMPVKVESMLTFVFTRSGQ
jgi:TonB family protein